MKKRSRKINNKKQESKTVDPAFDAAYSNITCLKNGMPWAVYGCYRKKKLRGCP